MAMARVGFRVWAVACYIVGLVSLCHALNEIQAGGAGGDGPSSLEFYVHNPGLFTSFPNGPTGLAMKGEKKHQQRSLKSHIITFDNVITAGNAGNSPVLGRAHGIRVVEKAAEGPLAFTWLFTASFNTSLISHGRGTLSFQGTTLNFPSSDVSDVTVTGGTGAFRFARGYATFTNFYKTDEIYTLEGQQFQVFLRY